MLAAFITTVLFALSGVTAQRTSRALGGVNANFARLIVATCLLAIWGHGFGQGFSGSAMPVFLLSGAVGFGFGDVALYQAFPRIGSRLSILLVHCVAAPFAAGIEWLWLGTALNSRQMFGGGLILAGVALALAPGKHLEVSRRTFWTGVVFGVVAALGQGAGALLSRYGFQMTEAAGEQIDAFTTAYQRIVAGFAVGALFFVMAGMRHSAGTPLISRARNVWPWILANALCGPALGVGFYQWALKQHGTGVVLPVVALTPLVIVPFSRYIEGERPRKRSLLGGVVAVGGVIILRLATG